MVWGHTLATTWVDAFGNKTLAAVTGGGLSGRTTATTYDPTGIVGASGPKGRVRSGTIGGPQATGCLVASVSGAMGCAGGWGHDTS